MSTPMSYWGKRMWASADLKRHVHEVRQRVDAMPIREEVVTDEDGDVIKTRMVNPRKERMIQRVSLRTGGEAKTLEEAPYLSPHTRHTLLSREGRRR